MSHDLTSPVHAPVPQRLGAPCRIVNALRGTFYHDPVLQRTCLALNSCTPGVNGAALLIDYQTGDQWTLQFPAGCGGWDMLQIAPDRLLFESLGDLHLVPVDLTRKQIDHDGIVPVQENQYAWRFSQLCDGWVYFGSFPTCHAYRYHVATHVVEDLGYIGPEGNLYMRAVAMANDEWLVCCVMTERSTVVALHIPTRRQVDLAITVDFSVPHVLAAVDGVVYATIGGRLHQFDSDTLAFREADVPAPPGNLHWNVLLPTSTNGRLVVQASDETYWLVEPGLAPRLIWNLSLRGGVVIGIDEDDRVVGKRGQDYFVAAPLAQTLDLKPLSSNPPPSAPHFLRADPAGGVTGGPIFGQTLFRFDPARNLLQNTPQVVDGAGEVYDGHWIDGKFYFVAYAGGDLAVWDPAQPWDQWHNLNPRRLVSYNTPEFGSLIRPQGNMAIGPRGRLYAGWSAAYGTAGGGLSEYDIAIGEARAWSSDLFATEMSLGYIAANERFVYGLTSNSFNGIRRKPQPPVFWVFDPLTAEVLYREPREGCLAGARVCVVPATGHIWLAEPAGCYRFDPEQRAFCSVLLWPEEVNGATDTTPYACDARGSTAWFFVGPHLVRLDDGAAPKIAHVLTAPELTPTLAAGTDGRLYFSQGVDVWSIISARGTA